MKKIKTVIFDLDGTIANTLPLCIAAFRNAIGPLLGKSLSDEDIIATFGPSEEGTIRKLIPADEEAGVKAYLEHYAQLHHTCPEAFAGIKELLDILTSAGVQLAMVKGKGIHSTKISLKQFGLGGYFEILETGSPEGPDKINGIRRVIARLSADLSESIYVGDAPSDIIHCKEVGIPIAAAAWATTAEPEKLIKLDPERIFYSITDFSRWIAERV
jgi:phosphoglycolate phosphatase/pyrophosphatase PpaX